MLQVKHLQWIEKQSKRIRCSNICATFIWTLAGKGKERSERDERDQGGYLDSRKQRQRETKERSRGISGFSQAKANRDRERERREREGERERWGR